ncbi:MAG: S-layer protein, partial [Selenomonas sp.]|nr:S-layer protein [Selenomonas sp.]
GAWLAYRYLGAWGMVASTYDVIQPNEKGWELGANYTPFKNIVTTVRYGKDKKITGGQKVDRFFGRVEFFF